MFIYIYGGIYVGSDSYKKLKCIYGGIHKTCSQDLWRDSYVGRDSYKEFICIYEGIDMQGEIHIRSSHVSMEGFICEEAFI